MSIDVHGPSSWRCSRLAFGGGPFRAGAAPVPDRGYRLALVQLGAGCECLIETVRAQRLAEPSHQLGLCRP